MQLLSRCALLAFATLLLLNAQAMAGTNYFLDCQSTTSQAKATVTLDDSAYFVFYEVNGGAFAPMRGSTMYSGSLQPGGYLFNDRKLGVRGALLIEGTQAQMDFDAGPGRQESFECSVRAEHWRPSRHCRHDVCS